MGETFSCLLLATLTKATSISDRWCDTYPFEIAFRLHMPPCFAAGVTGDNGNFEVDQKPSFLSRVGNYRSRKMLKRLVFYRVCSPVEIEVHTAVCPTSACVRQIGVLD